jgi:hypothetical protein
VPVVFLAALAINLPGAAYLVGLKDIAAAHHPTAVDALLVVAFNLIMFVLAEIPRAQRFHPVRMMPRGHASAIVRGTVCTSLSHRFWPGRTTPAAHRRP